MKLSTIIKSAAILAVSAALPLGAFAAPQAKTTPAQGAIEKVDAKKAKAPKKEHVYHWLDT